MELFKFKATEKQLKQMGLRKFISSTEKKFLDGIENQTGLKIERQTGFLAENQRQKLVIYRVDGLIDLKIVIEYDGPKNHQSIEKTEKDEQRDKFLIENNICVFRLQWFDYVNFKDYERELAKEINKAVRVVKMLINLKEKQRQQRLTEEQRQRLENLYTISNISITGGENRIYSECWNDDDDLESLKF